MFWVWAIRILINLPTIISTIRQILALISLLQGKEAKRVAKAELKDIVKKHAKNKCKNKEACEAELGDFKKKVEEEVAKEAARRVVPIK